MRPLRAVLLALPIVAFGAVLALSPAEALAMRPRMVSVQPLEGPGAGGVRQALQKAVRARGYRVVSDVPKATGTGQYYTWARELGLTAFVSGELEPRRKRHRLTLLVWSGHNGSITGKWTVSAPPAHLGKAVSRGFWRHLGRALGRSKCPPEWREMTPAPTMRINAGSEYDGALVGSRETRRRRR